MSDGSRDMARTRLDCRTKQHTESGVSMSDGSRDMARTRSWRKKKEKKRKKEKKNELEESHKASPTGIANEVYIQKKHNKEQ